MSEPRSETQHLPEPYYEDDACVIYHGDCRDVLRDLPRLNYSVLTDPPYALRRRPVGICVECGNDDAVEGWTTCPEHMAYATRANQFEMLGYLSPNLAVKATHSRGYADHDPEAFAELLGEASSAVFDLLADGSVMVAFGGARTYHQLASAIERSGFRIHDMLVWTHDSGMPKAKTCLAPAHDPAVVAAKGTPRLDLSGAKRWPTNVIASQRNREANTHLTPKPVSLMRWCVDTFARGTTVLDPFMGSGTTLRASKDLGLKAVGIEIDEAYCEMAARRLSQEVLDFGGVA